MGRTKVQTRADDDTTQALAEYADEKDITQSEAVRRLIRDGLLTRGYELDVPEAATATDDGGEVYTVRQTGTFLLAASIGASVLATILTLGVLGMI